MSWRSVFCPARTLGPDPSLWVSTRGTTSFREYDDMVDTHAGSKGARSSNSAPSMHADSDANCGGALVTSSPRSRAIRATHGADPDASVGQVFRRNHAADWWKAIKVCHSGRSGDRKGNSSRVSFLDSPCSGRFVRWGLQFRGEDARRLACGGMGRVGGNYSSVKHSASGTGHLGTGCRLGFLWVGILEETTTLMLVGRAVRVQPSGAAGGRGDRRR